MVGTKVAQTAALLVDNLDQLMVESKAGLMVARLEGEMVYWMVVH